MTMTKLIAGASVMASILALSGCNLGYSLDNGGSGPESNNPFIGGEENASWRLELNKNGFGFKLQKRDKPGGLVEYTLTGDFTRLDNGYLELSIDNDTLPSGVPKKKLAAIEIGDLGVMIEPVEAGKTDVIALVAADECPGNDISANALSIDNQADATSEDSGFTGTFLYSINDKKVSVKGNALDDGFTDQNALSVESTECVDGYVVNDQKGDHYLYPQAALVEHRGENDTYTRIFTYPKSTISLLKNIDGDYFGFTRKYTTPGDMSYVTTTCAEGVCDMSYQTDYAAVEKNANAEFIVTLKDFDIPTVGFVRGKIKKPNSQYTDGNITCAVSLALAPSFAKNKRSLACIGQAPEDKTKIITFFMVSTEG